MHDYIPWSGMTKEQERFEMDGNEQLHKIQRPEGVRAALMKTLPECFIGAALSMLVWASPSWAAMHTESVTYSQGGTTLVGYLAYDDSIKTPRPAVLIVPEYWGVSDYIKSRTAQVASLGTIAFAADIYGNGLVAKDRNEARALSTQFMKGDRKLLLDRVNAAMQTLQSNPLTDKQKVAAIGYCFGGTAVLELARSGSPINGVVGFHCKLDTPHPAGPGSIKTKILVLEGAEDPLVPRSQISSFMDEMKNAQADWQMVLHGGAVHSFTNPGSGSNPASGSAYNEKADKRSWEQMKLFFAEIFK